MKLTGLVQTVAPIHITASQDRVIKRGNVTPTVVYPLFDYESGRMNYIPGISATHLRGALRRIASDIYIDRFREAGVKVPSALLNAARHGSTGGRPDTAGRSASDYAAQMDDPIMALFGGGPMMLPGHTSAAWALPVCRETVAANVVPLPHYLDPANLPEAWRLIAEGTAYSKLDMMFGQDMSGIVSDYIETITGILAAMDQRKSAKADGELDAPEDARRGSNILGYQFLIAGVLLGFSAGCDDALPDEAKGLFLEVLRRFFVVGRVGGLQRIGFGVEAFNLDTVASLLLDGEPAFVRRGDGLELATSLNPAVARYAASFARWSQDPEAIGLERMMRSAGLSAQSEPA